VIDSTSLSIEEVRENILSLVRQAGLI